ncbi:MarR family winged helix-turn-helix transcriptional regulator [Sulfitobacter sp. S190]|uniref:MarR family winged helix-turn-helix transcriptional regulator n=1 Tax=Sulfitobacter sp. S190 TaxID=2867022 RepID=UPI0021A35E25|nr:MarR family transcriptional regulator [Sulfitobacter sp. S190]UWR22593.1 MarR family transcriptional regulator [Sulfitobacter sp. S190]
MDDKKLENIVGALALALSDGLLRAASGDAPATVSAAALTLIGHAPGITIHELSKGLSLSHPGAVRLVDRMAAEGLVTRQKSDQDRRAVTLYLTDRGTMIERRILASRQGTLHAALGALTPEERQLYATLTQKILTTLVTDGEHAMTICRLCDSVACHDCPVEGELIARAQG